MINNIGINNIGKNDNNINIPWYSRTVNYNLANEIPKISNEKFNIEFPKPKSWETEQEKPQTNEAWQEQEQEQRQTQTEQEKNRVNVPTQEMPPIPAGKKKSNEEPDVIPDGIPVPAAFPYPEDWKVAIQIGETIWETWTPEQRTAYMMEAAKGISPDADMNKLKKGINYAVNYDYKHFNMGEYYNGLVEECGVVIAIVILIIILILIAIPGPQPI